MTLDDVLPAPEWSERHARRIAAPTETVWDALQEGRLADSPLSSLLARLRGVPDELVARRFVEHAPIPVLAAERPRSLVAAGVLRPWARDGGDPPRLDADGVRTFAQPGWAVCAMDVVLTPTGQGTLASTETRVRATDRAARVRFGLYWLLIRAGSGLIRRELLRTVARRAERGATQCG